MLFKSTYMGFLKQADSETECRRILPGPEVGREY